MYSIWLCTEAAQIRANSIEKYEISRDFLVGSNSDNPRYDILTAIIINISGKHDTAGTGSELIKMLTDLFDERLDGVEKVNKLKSSYGLKLTKDVESEVCDMCSYADAMENKGVEKERADGLESIVRSLKKYISDFDVLYDVVIENKNYSKVTKDQVMKYFKD